MSWFGSQRCDGSEGSFSQRDLLLQMPPSPREAQLLSFGRSRLRTRIIRCPCRARAFEERDYERPCSEEGKELGGTGAGPQTGGGEGALNRATPSWVRPACAGGVLRPDRQRDDGPRASRPKGTPPHPTPPPRMLCLPTPLGKSTRALGADTSVSAHHAREAVPFFL